MLVNEGILNLIMYANIECIQYYLPEKNLDNEDINKLFPDFSSEKIYNKTGIKNRTISSEHEFTSELATKAALNLINQNDLNKKEIDYLIVCTQSPDHLLPSTSSLVHRNLDLSKWCGAIDINQGCSGFIYSLGVANGLIESGQANNILLITSDTYTKHLNPTDHSTRTIFGDGAAALLLSQNSQNQKIGKFVYGTDGAGANNLVSYKGGMKPHVSQSYLYMNGPEVFHFTTNAVPELLEKLLTKNKINMDEIDFFIFHQANQFILDALQKKLKIPNEKFLRFFEGHGNTVSSSIPITMTHYIQKGIIKRGHKIGLIGFGVGYSYAASVITF